MKLVTAIIKPFKLDDLREALQTEGVSGMTVTEVKGFGQQQGKTELYHNSEFTLDFLPKLKVEIVVADEIVDSVIEVILRVCATGSIGDGKIVVQQVENLIRIRTGEMGAKAV